MKKALKEPDKILDLCLRLYDELKLETESKKAEYIQQRDGLKTYYASKIEAAVKAENTRLMAVIIERNEKVEKLTRDLEDARGQYGKLFEENKMLDAMNNELKLKNIELEKQCESLKIENERIISDSARMETENTELNILASQLNEQLDLRKRDVFGASTEKSSRIFNDDKKLEDPLSEDMEPEEKLPKNRSAKRALDVVNRKKKERKTRSAGGTKEERYSGLPQVDYCAYTTEDLNKKYGVGKWRVVFKTKKQKLCETRPVVYVRNIYSLIIEYIDRETGERKLKSLPYNPKDKSLVAASVVASVSTKLYDLGLPYFRIERHYKSIGVNISRQTMCNLHARFVKKIGKRVWEKLKQEQLKCPVQQIDETTWPVVIWRDKDKQQIKANGSRGYMWEHTTSELMKGHKIVWYEFTETRSADHLRKYLRNLALYIVSDAFKGYSALEEKSGGKIKVANCWMHLRRVFANAVLVKDLDKMSKKEILADPAARGLLLSNEIFKQDTKLKELSADERKAERLVKVKPCVDVFFEFVHSLDMNKLSGKLKDAVVYAKNQEKRLKVFLENGNIPIDNGECERRMKPLAILRKNSLFSYSLFGAQVSAIMFSLIETAKANGAEPYMYIKFLYENMSNGHYAVDEMMPWSASFKDFAAQNANSDYSLPKSCELPKAKLKVKGIKL